MSHPKPQAILHAPQFPHHPFPRGCKPPALDRQPTVRGLAVAERYEGGAITIWPCAAEGAVAGAVDFSRHFFADRGGSGPD